MPSPPRSARTPILFLGEEGCGFFRKSRSISSRRLSRRSLRSSSRSSLVRGPSESRDSSISACLTHSRSEVSVRSRSFATLPMLPTFRTSRTASAFCSREKERRLRRAMSNILAQLGLSGVSEKGRQGHMVPRQPGALPITHLWGRHADLDRILRAARHLCGLLAVDQDLPDLDGQLAARDHLALSTWPCHGCPSTPQQQPQPGRPSKSARSRAPWTSPMISRAFGRTR